MNESDHNPLSEKSWRRKLTPAEAAELEAWLSEHPEAQADWETELRLTEVISRLPDAPAPSNFTARVLQAVERESATGNRRRGRFWKMSLRLLLPRAAAAAVILGAGILAIHEHTVTERRAELAQSVKIVSGVRSLPSPQILQDFDTIQKMGATANAGPDRELLLLMK
jgi:anti-sigma factor RsiW